MRWVVRFKLLAAGCVSAVALAGAWIIPVPASADDSGFMKYLNSHGYTARYAGDEPISEPSVRALGHMICENLRVGRSVAVQAPSYPAWPQFTLIAEAAQHELCPGV